MKRIVYLLFFVISTLSLQSCINIIEILNLNKNGSGTYQITIDMSGMMANGMMKEMFMESMKEEEGMKNAIVDGSLELDTVIAFKDAPMGDGLNTDDLPEILEQVTMLMNMSESKGVYEMTLNLDFEQVTDIAEFYAALEESGDDSGFGDMVPAGGIFETGRKKLIRKALDTSALKEKMAEEDEENMAMMKMMMGGATYKTIYNMPKRVKKTTIPNAEVKGKTITVTNSYLDVMEGKAKMGGEIRYK